MTTREHLIESLRILCDNTKGGFRAVADKASVDDQSLYQILSGVKLPSGNPKGVGPGIQRKLDAAFPGWADASAAPTDTAQEERATYRTWPFRRLKPDSIRAVSDAQLDAIEEVVGAALNGMLSDPYPEVDWRDFARTLAMSMDREIGQDIYSAFVLKLEQLVAEHRPTRAPRRSGQRTN